MRRRARELDQYCSNCSCDACQPVTEDLQLEIDELQDQKDELERTVSRLQNHVMSQDKIIVELQGEAVTA